MTNLRSNILIMQAWHLSVGERLWFDSNGLIAVIQDAFRPNLMPPHDTEVVGISYRQTTTPVWPSKDPVPAIVADVCYFRRNEDDLLKMRSSMRIVMHGLDWLRFVLEVPIHDLDNCPVFQRPNWMAEGF